MSGTIRSERGDLHDPNRTSTGVDYSALIARGYSIDQAVKLLAAKAGVKRTTIYKRLRRVGLLAPYGKRPNFRPRVLGAYPTTEEIAARRVNRDPCLRCGVKADVGCKHNTTSSLSGVMFA